MEKDLVFGMGQSAEQLTRPSTDGIGIYIRTQSKVVRCLRSQHETGFLCLFGKYGLDLLLHAGGVLCCFGDH